MVQVFRLAKLKIKKTPPEETKKVLMKYGYGESQATAIAYGFPSKGTSISTPVPVKKQKTALTEKSLWESATGKEYREPGKLPEDFGKPKVSSKEIEIRHVASGQETASYEKIQEAEEKKREMAEVATAYQSHLYQPVSEKLALGQPTTPWQMEALGTTLTGVGAPLSLAFGHPEIREKTLSYVAKYPAETAWKTGLGAAAWPIVSGSEIVGHMRKGESGKAFGSLATTATVMGISIGTAKVGRYSFGKVLGYEPKMLKGAVGKTKVKKKVTITDKRFLLEMKAKQMTTPNPPKLKAVIVGKGKQTFTRVYQKGIKPEIMMKPKELGASLGLLKSTYPKTWKERVYFEGIGKATFKKSGGFLYPATYGYPQMFKPRTAQFQKMIPIQRQKQMPIIASALGLSSVLKSSQMQRQSQPQLRSMKQSLGSSSGLASSLGIKQIQKQVRSPVVSFGMPSNVGRIAKGGFRLKKGRGYKPLPTTPWLPPMPEFGRVKRRKRGKKRKPIYRKYRYTPSLGGLIGLVKPIRKAPSFSMGLRMRPKVKRRRKR